jgi:hypothetical protein
MATLRERSPAERLELAISANRLAGRLREAGREASGGSPRAVAGRDDLISMKRASGRAVDLEDLAALTVPELGAG